MACQPRAIFGHANSQCIDAVTLTSKLDQLTCAGVGARCELCREDQRLRGGFAGLG